MKTIERYALALLVLWVISIPASTYLGLHIIPKYVGIQELPHFSLLTRSIAWASFLIGELVNIAIAVWLFVTAKKGKETPWVWALLGLTGGVLSALLFFVLRIYERMESTANPLHKPTPDSSTASPR